MSKSITINSPVTVTAMGFGRDMRAVPRRMEFNGQTYHFADSGLRTVVRKGEKILQILTMSDGESSFFLRSDVKGSNWTLVGMSV